MKTNKTIGLLQKLQNILSRPVSTTIRKSFVRSHLDYGDIFTMKLITKHFNRNLSLFSIMPA